MKSSNSNALEAQIKIWVNAYSIYQKLSLNQITNQLITNQIKSMIEKIKAFWTRFSILAKKATSKLLGLIVQCYQVCFWR